MERREIDREPEWEQIGDPKRQVKVVGSSHLNTTWGSLKGGNSARDRMRIVCKVPEPIEAKNNRQLWRGGVWLDIIDPPPSVRTSQKRLCTGKGDRGGSIIQNKGKNGWRKEK